MSQKWWKREIKCKKKAVICALNVQKLEGTPPHHQPDKYGPYSHTIFLDD
jgi:hypothetical protein